MSALREILGNSQHIHLPGEAPEKVKVLPTGSPTLDLALPDGGLPRGTVVEVASKRGLARATSLALLACAAAQQEARLRSGDPRTMGAWCAFVDPWSTLHAPAVVANRVDPSRLLVVRPAIEGLARVVVRIAESRAFSLVVVDTVGVPGAALAASHMNDSVRLERWPTVVRRLAIAIERTDTTIILMTDASAARGLPLPVSLRLELSNEAEPIAAASSPRSASSPSSLGGTKGPWLIRVAKDRYGRIGAPVACRLDVQGDLGVPDAIAS